MTDGTFTLLGSNGSFQARGVSITEMMLLMDRRWGGTLVCDKTGTVLFDPQKDRPEYAHPEMKKIPAAVRHANCHLAWERWHAEQGK